SRTWRRSLRSSSRSSVVSPSSRSAAIELLLLAPKPQRLAADAELGGDLRNRAAARLEQTDRLTPELRRVRPRVPRGHFASPSSPDEGTLAKRSDVRRSGGTSLLGAELGRDRARRVPAALSVRQEDDQLVRGRRREEGGDRELCQGGVRRSHPRRPRDRLRRGP